MRFDHGSDTDIVDRAGAVPFDQLSAACADWQNIGIEKTVRERTSPFGRYSIVASYEPGSDRIAKLEMDYPFFGWHNLTNCYALRGWEVPLQQYPGNQASRSTGWRYRRADSDQRSGWASLSALQQSR